jgi:subtilisin family serine protease
MKSMKKLITSIILFVSFSQCIYSQEYAVYSSNKQKTILTVSPEKVLVWFVPNLTEDRKKQTLAKISLNGLLASNDEMPHTRILSLKEGKTADDAMRLVKDLLKEESVLYASPVLVGPEGTSLGGLTNELIVKLKKTTSLAFLEQLAKAKNIEKIVQYEYDPLVYILTINKHSSTHTLDLSNQFLETGKFEFAHPNYHLFIKTATSDPYFNLQWNVKNTGQVVNLITGTVGEDIKVEQTWNISTGSGIKVAVIDDGIQENHPDLSGKVLASDDVTISAGIAPKKHGTTVAGVIAAIANNNEGIVGVAYNANLVSIRTVISGDAFATEAEVKWIASAIDRARVVHNVDVINISLECFFYDQIAFGIYENALNNAINLGRGGKGIPIFVSSGNSGSNDPNAFPFFNLLASYDQVIAVGASTNIGKRASFSSFGSTNKMSVVAPGILIPTTDLIGTDGYSSNSAFISGFLDNNYMRLSGTSFSCPNAAGVGALILSYNPNFTQTKVREIIETTADIVGGYHYAITAGKPNGLWHTEMGYGRVNAYQSLLKAQLCTFAPSSSLLSVSGQA